MGWGILGAAWIADRAVLPAIAASRNGRLVAIGSRNPDRAQRFATMHHVARVSADYEAVLADPDVDAVYIPLINNLHREWAMRAFAARKHVLCEKPLAMNASEASDMADAAHDANVLLMEAFMYRFHPRMRAFAELHRDAQHVAASFGFPLADGANYRLRPEHGGGALMDVGCYTVDVARWLMDAEPEKIEATARVDPETGVDMTTSIQLGFAGGRTASLWCSFESEERQQLTVTSAGGTAVLERPFSAWRDPDDPYQLMVESFGDAILDGDPVPLPPTHSIANMRVLDRIRIAAGL
ncbi:MAG TPA: Gfo/Idh/MocA family oxidoreductase [Candidatus Dormibacteraeota bacterium]|nr:Gfo/Idh/MocA family oxidoreductase [Candidatus Dormibacteraeota bacterium]